MNPSERMVFEGTCNGDACKQAKTKFRWSLYRKRDDGTFQSVDIRKNEDLALLEINGNKLAEGANYTLELHGNLTEKIKSARTHSFITNESPRGGNCTVDKSEGIVLETNFTFSCFGWLHTEKELVYQFGYTSSSGAYEILQESSQRFLRTNKLPLGDSKKENIVQVDIYVKDKWGGFGFQRVEVKVSLVFSVIILKTSRVARRMYGKYQHVLGYYTLYRIYFFEKEYRIMLEQERFWALGRLRVIY